MVTRKNSAELARTLALIHRHNSMIYKASTLKSVPFPPSPFSKGGNVMEALNGFISDKPEITAAELLHH